MTGSQAGGFLIPRLNSSSRFLLGSSTDNGQLARLEATTTQFAITYSGVATYNFLCDVNGNLKVSKDSTENFRISAGGFTKHSNNGTFAFSALARHEYNSNQDAPVCAYSSTSTGSSAIGIESHLPSGAAGRFFACQLNGTAVAQILANGNVQNTNNSYGAISDRRLKENIKPAGDYLERFMRVQYKTANLIATKEKQFCVIAQELEEVFPGLIEEVPLFDEEGKATNEKIKTVKYSVLAQIQGKVIQEIEQKYTKEIDLLKEQLKIMQENVSKLLNNAKK